MATACKLSTATSPSVHPTSYVTVASPPPPLWIAIGGGGSSKVGLEAQMIKRIIHKTTSTASQVPGPMTLSELLAWIRPKHPTYPIPAAAIPPRRRTRHITSRNVGRHTAVHLLISSLKVLRSSVFWSKWKELNERVAAMNFSSP